MDLSPRLLAFLEHEMKQIMEDPDRDLEDREHASTVLGRIEGEIEYEKEQQLKEDAEASELFA
jgi:hypothetical protein